MQERFARALETIGLSEKEARVYLAALELGPSSAQMLAAKATVNRPTAYIMIESLIKRGLMGSVEKGSKRLFSAAVPEQLLELTAAQRKDIEEKERVAREILPDLTRFASGKERPSVEVIESEDAWTSLQRDMLATNADEAFDLSFAAKGAADPACLRGELRDEVLAAYRINALVSSGARTGAADAPSARLRTRIIGAERLPLGGEAVLYGTKVILVSPGPHGICVRIDDSGISATLRVLCMTAWNAAEAPV